jgi:hypothetical protein
MVTRVYFWRCRSGGGSPSALELLDVELGALDVGLDARRDARAVDVGRADPVARDQHLLEDVLAAGLDAASRSTSSDCPLSTRYWRPRSWMMACTRSLLGRAHHASHGGPPVKARPIRGRGYPRRWSMSSGRATIGRTSTSS